MIPDDVRLRLMRRLCSGQGWALVIYYGIMNIAVLTVVIVSLIMDLEGEGWGYFLAIGIGFIGLLLWKKPDFCFGTIWQKEKPMGMGSLFRIGTVFVSLQLVFTVFSVLWACLWESMGMEYTPVASVDTTNWSMLLYAAVGAPVAEELLFRGVIFRSLQPCGKKFAILASAILFGAFHGNLIQGIYAFAVGVILGYVAAEYHILWAMALHMFNNLVLAVILPEIGQWLGVGEGLTWLVVLGSGVAAAVVLLLRRRYLGGYLWNKGNDPLCWRAFFTAPGILVFLIMMAASAIFLEWNALR